MNYIHFLDEKQFVSIADIAERWETTTERVLNLTKPYDVIHTFFSDVELMVERKNFEKVFDQDRLVDIEILEGPIAKEEYYFCLDSWHVNRMLCGEVLTGGSFSRKFVEQTKDFVKGDHEEFQYSVDNLIVSAKNENITLEVSIDKLFISKSDLLMVEKDKGFFLPQTDAQQKPSDKSDKTYLKIIGAFIVAHCSDEFQKDTGKWNYKGMAEHLINEINSKGYSDKGIQSETIRRHFPKAIEELEWNKKNN